MDNETLLDESLKAELASLYRSPDRHYHGMGHIEALLGMAREYADQISDRQAVEAAIWFHDAVYDSRRSDNELASAELAREKLAGRAEPERLDRIAGMIEATATHTPPAIRDPAAARDAMLFLDMDLSILGASQKEFDSYEAGVRREYDWVDDERWRKGRAEVLQRFADRPFIYFSEPFRQRFEAAARQNLARSIARLAANA